MTFKHCSIVLISALLLWGTSPSAEAPGPPDKLTLSVMFLEQPRLGGMGRLWLAIKNTASVPRVFCRPSWGYMWFSDNGPAFGEQNAQLHGCGGSATDPFWVLMPGERRFDSFEIKTPAAADYELEVDVDVVEAPLGSSATGAPRTLSWKGQLSDAIALGQKVKAGRVE